MRMGLLGMAGVLEGLLLANGPVLKKYAALRLGPEGILLDVDLLCAIVLGLLGALGALRPWMQSIFLGLAAGAMTWSLAESSLHPFWIVSKKGIWRPHDPAGPVMLGHVIALFLIGSAALLDALARHRRVLREQRVAPADIAQHSGRLAMLGFAVLGVAAVATIPLTVGLGRLADALRGAVEGATAFAVLMGSALLLLLGLGLLASQGKSRQPSATGPPTDEPGERTA